MIDDPIDDYLQALIGQAMPDNGDATANNNASAAVQDSQPDTPARVANAISSPDDALLAELDAAFDQARDSYQQTQAASSKPACSPDDALLAELDAAFDQARDSYQHTQAASNKAACSPDDALLAELDAAFDQARDCYQHTQATASKPACSPDDALLAELDAAFDQARDSYQHTQAASNKAACSPDDALLTELDAAFDQARSQFETAQPAAPAAPALANQDDAALQAVFDAEQARYQQDQRASARATGNPRRIPPAPIGPPMLAISGNTAQPIWQAAGSQGQAPAQEPRRRASERASRWLRLRCDEQPYALELLKVQEVVLLAPLLYLRGAPHYMLGIMNLRGQVVPVMDLGLYLGGEAAQITPATRIVVLESEGQSLGLRVSAVDDVASLTQSQIEPPDTTRLCRFSNHLFRGVARLSGPPIILLDANALLN